MEGTLIYPESEVFFDKNYLRYLLEEERDGMVEVYVEGHFPEESWDYQTGFMLKFPYFANKILDDDDMENEEKQEILFKHLTQHDKKEGKIVLVDGAMGGGKTGFGCWLLDEYHKRKENINYFFVTKSTTKPELPNWFKVVNDMKDVEKITLNSKFNSVALVDEGAIQLNSRRAMTRTNIDASEFLVQLRQKGITMIFLVQNTKMVDANVRRLASIRVLKHGIVFGEDEKKIKDDLKHIRDRLRPRSFRECYIEILSSSVHLNIKHGLPAWWDDQKVSKYMDKWDKSGEAKLKEKPKQKTTEDELFDEFGVK